MTATQGGSEKDYTSDMVATACHVLQRLQGGVGREALADAARPGVANVVAVQAARYSAARHLEMELQCNVWF